MDLKLYYQKVRNTEAEIPEVVSRGCQQRDRRTAARQAGTPKSRARLRRR